MKQFKDINIKTIRYPVALDDKLNKLAKKFGRPKLQIFREMVEYFTRTGKDPADINDELLKGTLIKNHDTYTANSQQETTTKGTLFGAYNSITGYFQNVRNFRDEESKFKSIMYGTGLQRGQSAFDLCTDFAKTGNEALMLN